MKDSTLVTVATFANPFEAELAKSFLEEAGIEAVLQNERIMSMYSSIGGYMHMIELQVSTEKEQEAKQILVSLDDSEYVKRILTSEQALLSGHFQLTSGKHSHHYIEKIRVFQNPEATHNICRRMAARLEQYDFDCVVGPAYGGIVLAFETALLLHKTFIFTQRKDEKMVLRSGFDISGIKRVAVVEDILTTGGSVAEVVECLQNLGLEIAVIGIMVDRSGGNVSLNAPIESLLSLHFPAWEPQDCELCKEQLPLTKPGSSDKKK